jgi:hypothetical protein
MENEKRLIEEVLWEAYFERDIKNLFFVILFVIDAAICHFFIPLNTFNNPINC